MSTIVEELKKKIISAGGDASGVQTISDCVNRLPEGGSSEGVLEVFEESDTDTDTIHLSAKMGEIINAIPNVYIVSGDDLSGMAYIRINSWAYSDNTYSISTDSGTEYFANSLDESPAESSE